MTENLTSSISGCTYLLLAGIKQAEKDINAGNTPAWDKIFALAKNFDFYDFDIKSRFDRASSAVLSAEDADTLIECRSFVFCTNNGWPDFKRADELLKKIGF